MDVDVVFGTRDFGEGWEQPAGGWQVEQMRWSAYGGPDTAWITCAAPGGTAARWQDLLRCPVEVFTLGGRRCWWGYVSSLGLEGGGGQMRFSLDGMRNVVVCRYRELSGAERVLRVRDEASVALYGEKETLLDLGESTALRAEAAARAVLERRGRVETGWQAAQRPGPARVRLGLRGWWHSLGWRLFFSQGEGCAAVEAPWNLDAEASVGMSSAQVMCAQALVDDHGPFLSWQALELEVCAQRVGSPADTLRASLHAVDPSGIPYGAAMDTVDVPAGDAMQPVRVSLSGAAQVTPGTAFGVVLWRSGAVSSASGYRIGCNEQAGLRYPCRVWNGSAWAVRSPQANALARVLGGGDTTRLLGYYAGPQRGGQFLRRVLVEEPSGILAAVHEQRVRTCQQEVEDLLLAGRAGGGRLLAEIDPQRVLRAWAAPEAGAPRLSVGLDGSLWHPGGAPVEEAGQALGAWARYQAWPDAPAVFVQGCEISGGRLRITAGPGRGWPR